MRIRIPQTQEQHDKARKFIERGLDLESQRFAGCNMLAIIDNDGEVRCVIVHNFVKYEQGKIHVLELSIYADTPRWCTPSILKQLFGFWFDELGVDRLQVICAADNEKAIMFCEKLGWLVEGQLRHGWTIGKDAVILSMLREDCVVLREDFGSGATRLYD